MKRFRVISLALAGLVALAASAFADGILRVPLDYQDDIIYPLVGVSVKVEIRDQIAITTVSNTFQVAGDSTRSAIYHYRLPAEASMTGFGVWYGDQYYPFKLRAGEQGGTGGGAADNPNLKNFLGVNPFSMQIDSIPPGLFKTQIQYAELLPYDFGVVTMNYPLYCGNFLSGSIDTVDLVVDLQTQRAITELTTYYLQDSTATDYIDSHHTTITMHASELIPQQDWALDVRFNQEDIGAWLYTHRSNMERDGYFMLIIDPGIVEAGEQVQKYFTFVFDESGSMAGSKIAQEKTAVSNCLDHLVTTDYFNLIHFATNVAKYSNQMLLASSGNIRTVKTYINNLNAAGSTNTYGALMQAISQNMGEGTANQVIFTTDGLPTVGETTDCDEIVAAISNSNQYHARIFSVGIGRDLNEPFLRGLAEANRGQAVMIDPNEGRIDKVIEDFYRYLANPALVNPVVQIGDSAETDSLYPPVLQDLAAGKQLYLVGRYNTFEDCDIVLSGSMPGGDTSLTYAGMPFPEENQDNAFVPRMWAKTVIDYYLDWMKVHGERQDYIKLIIQLSLEYGILTPYTEYQPPPNAIHQPGFARLDATIRPAGVQLSWAVRDIQGSVTFNLYRAFSPTGEFVLINDAPLTTNYYFDEGVDGSAGICYRIEALVDGEAVASQLIIVGSLPTEMTLQDPSPNPFNGVTELSYLTTRSGEVTAALYDTEGRIIRTLFQGRQEAGAHILSVDGTGLPSGCYLVRLSAEGRIQSKALALVR